MKSSKNIECKVSVSLTIWKSSKYDVSESHIEYNLTPHLLGFSFKKILFNVLPLNEQIDFSVERCSPGITCQAVLKSNF